jgi:hypothetical protein
MAFDGNGTFNRLYSWVQDASNGINITASRVDAEDSGFATALSLCVTRDSQGKMAADFVPGTTGVYNLGTVARQWLAVNAISAAIGAISVGPAASGASLSVNGGALASAAFNVTGSTAANQFVARFNSNNTTAGQSYGIQVLAGTNTADYTQQWYNAAGTLELMAIDGAGNLQVSNGAGNNLVGPVYAGIPQDLQSGASYSLVLTDANKHIYNKTAGCAYTIPANGSVAFPIGTATTFVNRSGSNATIAITTDTLVWAAGGGTGTRTLANNGIATILKVESTVWMVSGTGLS